MADNNQQPESNEPLENNQWEEKEWQAKMDYAKAVLAKQQAEAEQAKLTATQQAEAAEEAEEDEGSQEDQEAEWAARLALAKGASRTGANEDGASPENDRGAQAIKELDALDKQIAALDKKTDSDYITGYLFLTTGAAVVDLLQAISDAAVILAILSSISGVTYSVVRHYGLKYSNSNATPEEHKQMLNRTLISGAITMIPYVNLLPEQTAFMLREWTIKRESISAAKDELVKLKTKRKKLAASLPK
jgi:hypothetical protein